MSIQDDDSTRTHVVLTPGTWVQQYRIIEKIGSGGMGEVYLADDSRLHRQVALKLLPRHFADDAEIRQRFTREAQAAASLNHANIVTIHEVGEFNGLPFFAMEYVKGHSLSHLSREQKRSMGEIVDLAIQICDGLGKAHQMGIVHRDIKPSNIVVDADQRARILDFGLAAVQGADTLTKTGSTLGTIAYMSPEQAQGKELDRRTDIFSFGVVLYELITGQSPFKRDHDAATLHAIVHDTPEPLARFRANTPEELQRIVTKLLERDPGLRYQTASDIISDLRKLSLSSSQPPSRPAGARRNRLLIYAATLGVLLLTLGTLLAIRARRGGDSSTAEMTITPLTSDGKVTTAAISRDGNYVVYATADSGHVSVWIQHLASGGKVQIVDTSDVTLLDLCFSPDGNFVVYRLLQQGDMGELSRVPVLGGTAHQIASDVWSKATFSPSGARIAFWRVLMPSFTRAVIKANADGTQEETLTTHVEGASMFFTNEPAWSPDGKVIAISRMAPGQSAQTQLAMLDSTTGRQVAQIAGNWIDKLSLDWLPADGLIAAASHHANPFGRQLWHVTYPEGIPKRITNDLNSYDAVSLTADGKLLAVVQTDTRAGIWLIPVQDTENSRQILDGKYDGLGGLCWADNSSLVYFTRTANDYCLNRYFIDRGKQELVVRGHPIVIAPAVSRNGHTAVFYDAGDQYSQISACDLDGRNRRSLTGNGVYGWPDVSPDGDWAVYCDFATGYPRIRKTSMQGEAGLYLDSDSTTAQLAPRISPDGRWVACYYVNLPVQKLQIAIFPSDGGNPANLLDADQTLEGLELAWSADGSSLFYVDTKNGVSNIWSRPIKGGTPRQVTFFHDQRIDDFDVSIDGNTLAVCRSRATRDVVLMEGFH